ncbi:response regulator [Legionella tunisiensis]|uniref:response regulator n=1 Tax=Legionella tunisiensis TaxID=1034944 RepID=UPI0002E576DA|nr:response regulator [Legionella tunisiensis]
MIIILVEDNIVNQTMMKQILANNFKNSIVKVIGDGETAIAFFNGNLHYDLIILDGNLGSKTTNGPEVAQAIVNAGINTPVALWTDDKATREKMEKVFGHELPCIEKAPLNKNNIISVVKNILELASEPITQRRQTY